MSETDRRNLYDSYIRMLAGAVLADQEWKQKLLGLAIGRRFAVNAASLTWLKEIIRAVEECQSKGLQIPDGLKWLDEPCRQGIRLEQLRVVVFKGDDSAPVGWDGFQSRPTDLPRVRFWFGAGPGGPPSWDQADSADNETWYTLQSVEFPDIRIEFGFSA